MTEHEIRVERARRVLWAAGWDRLDERAEAIARSSFADVERIAHTLTNLRDALAPPLSEQLEAARKIFEENTFP